MTDAPLPLPQVIDPLPAGRIGMWLFCASDLMFFVGLVGAFIVLREGNVGLFSDHQRGLHVGLAGAGVGAMIFSSVALFAAMRAARKGSTTACGIGLLLTLLCAGAFVALRSVEYADTFNHHTIVARASIGGSLIVFDGAVSRSGGATILTGYSSWLPPDFDLHVVSQSDVAHFSAQGEDAKTFTIPGETFEDVRYGPGKNIFYAIWFTLTGAQLIHAVAGLIAIAILLVQVMRTKVLPMQIQYVAMYWHFTVFIGVVLFPLIYLS